MAHATQSEEMTLAATQSIMTEEYVDIQDTVQPIVEEEVLPSIDDCREDSKGLCSDQIYFLFSQRA
jgi:hypothetical protein